MLSAKVSALLDSGKISSAGAAVQLEKLAQKNEVKADSLIGQIEEMPEGKKLSRKIVDSALSEEGGRRKKKDDVAADTAAVSAAAGASADPADQVPPWEDALAAPSRRRVNRNKVERVARILGMADSDEEEILVQLIDAFLALKGESSSSI